MEGMQQDIRERKTYAGRIFHLVVYWLSSILLIVMAQGIRWPWMSQYISASIYRNPC